MVRVGIDEEINVISHVSISDGCDVIDPSLGSTTQSAHLRQVASLPFSWCKVIGYFDDGRHQQKERAAAAAAATQH
jgi:hypothetical protein